MKILVAMPSKSLNDPMIVEGNNYLARMRSQISASSLMIPPKSMIGEEHRDKRIILEGAELLQKTTGHVRIGLAEHGKEFTSMNLVNFLIDHMSNTKKMAFIIGGAFGLPPEVLQHCKLTLSLSRMTMPHKMAFLVLCEQLYRADEILRGTAYHK